MKRNKFFPHEQMSYCGKEYPDEATNCAIDNELLSDNSPPLATVEKQKAETTPKKDEPYLTFPDCKWSARAAWKCIGIWDGFVIRIGHSIRFLG
jgi:hypothetical protein